MGEEEHKERAKRCTNRGRRIERKNEGRRRAKRCTNGGRRTKEVEE